MGKQILIRLDEIDVGQVIDGLQARADSWRATERYFKTGEAPSNIEECTDGDEAHAIAECYERIITSITSQRNRQTTTA
jgi:hypothetical protein